MASRWFPASIATSTQLREELTKYFAGTLTDFTTPLIFRGTPFEERVWRELTRIPYGETISYAQLADRIDSPGGQRAVGRANGMNRIAIVIPCHRVVNADGKLGWIRRRAVAEELPAGARATQYE